MHPLPHPLFRPKGMKNEGMNYPPKRFSAEIPMHNSQCSKKKFILRHPSYIYCIFKYSNYHYSMRNYESFMVFFNCTALSL